MAKIEKNPLGGESDPNRFRVTDASGNLTNINKVVFPIFGVEPDGNMKFIGTGFFLTVTGVFATARHVLRDIFESNSSEKQIRGIQIAHMLPNGKIANRTVIEFTQSNMSDVAVGLLQPLFNKNTKELITTPVLPLTLEIPPEGDDVVTYAHPNTTVLNGEQTEIHMYPDYYDGKFVEYFPNGRDRGMMSHPCFHTTIMSHGGSSGGPVFDAQGRVFGINCVGMQNAQCAHSSRVHELLPITIASKLYAEHSTEQTVQAVTIEELARQGHVVFDPPL